MGPGGQRGDVGRWGGGDMGTAGNGGDNGGGGHIGVGGGHGGTGGGNRGRGGDVGTVCVCVGGFPLVSLITLLSLTPPPH